MKKLVITVQTEGASAAERGVVFRHLEKLGDMGGFARKAHERCVTGSDSITWSGGGVMQSSAAPEELTITVSGPTGSGKTVILSEIRDMLAKRGVKTEDAKIEAHADSCRIVTREPAFQLKSTRLPRVVTVQAVEVKVSAGEAMAAIDKVDLALAVLSVPADNINSELYDAANSVLLGLLEPQPSESGMRALLMDMANETLKWSHDVDAVNRAAAIKEKYKHG